MTKGIGKYRLVHKEKNSKVHFCGIKVSVGSLSSKDWDRVSCANCWKKKEKENAI